MAAKQMSVFFVAGGDAPERLYPAKEILDQMAPFVFLRS